MMKFLEKCKQALGLSPKIYDPEKSESFCILPWIHSHFTTDGQATLCCISPDGLMGKNGEGMHVQKYSMHDILHSPAMNEVRSSMLQGKNVKACNVCYSAEKLGSSNRKYFNQMWRKRVPDIMDRVRAAQEKPAFEKPISADLRFGNLCNLKCQICNTHNSSQVEKDPTLAKWNPGTYRRMDHRFQHDGEWYDAPELEKEIISFGSDILFVNVGGGEPAISKPLLKWFRALVESGQAAKIQAHISSNLTNMKMELFDLASQFRGPFLNLSIDGYKSLNEYLRHPSKWETIEKNADYLSKLMETTALKVNIAPVISVYNALTIHELFAWADRRKFGIVAGEVRGVDQIDCAIIPKEARRLAVERMRKFLAEAKNPHATYSSIEQLCRYLEQPVDQNFAERNTERFFEFNGELDRQRKMYFELYCPEMAKFLQYPSASAVRPLEAH